MIVPEDWMPEVVSRLAGEFGDRLVYVGLQGSYRRGESSEASDIDLVTVLDRLDAATLGRYCETVRAMPEGGKACGFLSDRRVLANWPRHEIFSFSADTRDYFGVLQPLLPAFGRTDIVDGARIGAANLYHLVAHGYAPSGAAERADMLAGAYKGAYFVMLLVAYLRTGRYFGAKAELARHTTGAEKEIMAASLNYAEWRQSRSEEEATDLLLDWCAGIVADYKWFLEE